jgi:RNA polymerase sigma-70 factor (ECF subfamily)
MEAKTVAGGWSSAVLPVASSVQRQFAAVKSLIMGFALPDIPTEDLLLTRANRGDQAALAQIYEVYFPSVYRFIRYQVEDQALAEDIASDVFITLMDNVGSRSGPRHSLRGWLFRVARNEVYRHFGKVKQFPRAALEDWIPDSAEPDLEVQFIRAVDTDRARRALRMLVPEQQEVLILRFVEALSLQETADIMGKSASAVKSLQFRAVNALRSILGEMKLENYG